MGPEGGADALALEPAGSVRPQGRQAPQGVREGPVDRGAFRPPGAAGLDPPVEAAPVEGRRENDEARDGDAEAPVGEERIEQGGRDDAPGLQRRQERGAEHRAVAGQRVAREGGRLGGLVAGRGRGVEHRVQDRAPHPRQDAPAEGRADQLDAEDEEPDEDRNRHQDRERDEAEGCRLEGEARDQDEAARGLRATGSRPAGAGRARARRRGGRSPRGRDRGRRRPARPPRAGAAPATRCRPGLVVQARRMGSRSMQGPSRVAEPRP